MKKFLWQQSFSKSWSWPPKQSAHKLTPAQIHVQQDRATHRHKNTINSQELRLRLAILVIGIIIIALLLFVIPNS